MNLSMDDDAAWVRRMQSGDESAFDALFAAYRHRAVRTAALVSGDPALAEDIAQEAFVRCLLHIRELRNPACFRPWFYRILTRCAWDAMERRARTSGPDWDEAVERCFPAATDTYPSERRAEYEPLYRALDALGRKQRATVILYYFNELTIREIARATASPEGTVKTRLFAARRQLHRALQGWYEGEKEEAIHER